MHLWAKSYWWHGCKGHHWTSELVSCHGKNSAALRFGKLSIDYWENKGHWEELSYQNHAAAWLETWTQRMWDLGLCHHGSASWLQWKTKGCLFYLQHCVCRVWSLLTQSKLRVSWAAKLSRQSGWFDSNGAVMQIVGHLHDADHWFLETSRLHMKALYGCDVNDCARYVCADYNTWPMSLWVLASFQSKQGCDDILQYWFQQRCLRVKASDGCGGIGFDKRLRTCQRDLNYLQWDRWEQAEVTRASDTGARIHLGPGCSEKTKRRLSLCTNRHQDKNVCCGQAIGFGSSPGD